jgi:3-oxoadipate enol-lactonase
MASSATTADFFTVNSAKLYAEVRGSGEPLVLLHGFGLDLTMWDLQIGQLSERYRVLRYDLRGFGRSSLPAAGELYSHEQDLKGLLGQTLTAPAHVVGSSNGGRYALRFALAYPELVRSLALIDSSLDGFEMSSESYSLWNTVASMARSGKLAAAKRLWLEQPLFRSAMQNLNARARLMSVFSDYSGWHWLNIDPVVVPSPVVERLHEIRAPTLIVTGERDLEDFHWIAELLSANILNSVKAVLPNAGHLSSLEQPMAFADLLIDFLEGEHQ